MTGGTGSLNSSGGSVTVGAGSSITLIVGGLVNCGQHYELSFSGPHGNGSDCEVTGFNYTISSPYVQPNDVVTVSLILPPNSCPPV